MVSVKATENSSIQTPLSAIRNLAYRGRLAPSPTGYLHLGHAFTFSVAAQRARGGTLILRNEDLDPQRSRPEFAAAFIEDLRWLGLSWQEGCDIGGPFAPYSQSERREFYLAAWRQLWRNDCIYPCNCSRRELQQAASAPHEPAPNDEPLYAGTCRDKSQADFAYLTEPRGVNWRFRVPDGANISFTDGYHGLQNYQAGREIGDFIIWRRDDVPAYQLAVVVDDAAMQITEVVRGADLLISTARQILLQQALHYPTPAYYHCPLLTDANGQRLAKRHDALSLRALRGNGETPAQVWARMPANASR